VFSVVVPAHQESVSKSGIEAPELATLYGVFRTIDCRDRERTNPVFYGDTSSLKMC
jgi:hypothetical protein